MVSILNECNKFFLKTNYLFVCLFYSKEILISMMIFNLLFIIL